MAVYYIVASGTTPLGPNEIEAGSTITPNLGDVFIFTAGADATTVFDSTGSVGFDVQFDATNTNAFDVRFEGGTNPTVTIEDDVELADVFLDARNAETINVDIGDRVILDRLRGSAGDDTVTIGDDFTTNRNLALRGGDDEITIGQDANLSGNQIRGGGGSDTITSETQGLSITSFASEFYPDGTVDGTSGDDVMSAGFVDAQRDEIGAEDDIILGYAGDDTIDGGAGNDLIEGGSGADSLWAETTAYWVDPVATQSPATMATTRSMAEPMQT